MKRQDEVHADVSSGRPGLLFGAILWLILLAAIVSSWVAFRRWWFPPVASDHGLAIDRLMNIFFIIISIVFVGVHVVMAYFVIRYRRRDAGGAVHWHENKALELAWTITPAIILFGMMLAGGSVWARVNTTPPEGTLQVEVFAEQFGWNIRYPGPDGQFGNTDPRLISSTNRRGIDPNDPAGKDDIVLLNELRLPVDRPVHVLLRAKDVIHSFFVPQFRVKKDTVPGRTTELSFTPNKVGEFEIACAELCGVGHWVMRGVVKVLPQEEFDAWLAAQGASLGTQDDPNVPTRPR